jgi:cell division inhibitor SulA
MLWLAMEGKVSKVDGRWHYVLAPKETLHRCWLHLLTLKETPLLAIDFISCLHDMNVQNDTDKCALVSIGQSDSKIKKNYYLQLCHVTVFNHVFQEYFIK